MASYCLPPAACLPTQCSYMQMDRILTILYTLASDYNQISSYTQTRHLYATAATKQHTHRERIIFAIRFVEPDAYSTYILYVYIL